jgi:hypothetical protein
MRGLTRRVRVAAGGFVPGEGCEVTLCADGEAALADSVVRGSEMWQAGY